MESEYEVIVIGGGPAGYAAAIRAAQLGMRTACIDNRLDAKNKPAFGGACLNVGCIPSKTLLDISHKFADVKNKYASLGIVAGDASIDVARMQSQKQQVVSKLVRGIASLFKASGVDALAGTGMLHSGLSVEFTPHGGEPVRLKAEHVILAPGSVPIELGSVPLALDAIVDSTGALEFSEPPEHLGIIGAGVIGLELGSVWGRLGSKVTILEAMDEFLPMLDQEIAMQAKKIFERQKMDIRLGARVLGSKVTDEGVELSYSDSKGNHTQTFDRVIVAVGRRPYTQDLLSPECGVDLDERGFIAVDDECASSVPHVYAVGDAVRGPMLAHKASHEGVTVVERIAGHKPSMNYDCIPNVIYTHPEVAWIGLSEEEATAQGLDPEVGRFPFAANGRALAAADSDGQVKIITDASSDRICGVIALGPAASELIAQAGIAMEFDASAEDLGLTVFAHPTLSEALHEAALDSYGAAIHMPGRG